MSDKDRSAVIRGADILAASRDPHGIVLHHVGDETSIRIDNDALMKIGITLATHEAMNDAAARAAEVPAENKN